MLNMNERTQQLDHKPGSQLDELRRAACRLMPRRHWDGCAGWVEITETLRYDETASGLTPAQLAERATKSLDAAATDWAIEQQQSS